MADATIRRSIGKTIGFAVLSLALAAGAIALLWNGYWLGIVVACVAALFGGFAYDGPKKANCPQCGKPMSADAFGNPMGRSSADGVTVAHCPACGQYSRPEGGALVKLAPDYVDGNAVFPVHLDRLIKPGSITGLPKSDMHDVRWPNICIVCSAPPTRTDPVEVIVSRMSGPMTTQLRLRFPFPCCARHHVHPEIAENTELWSGPGFECDHVQLRFQSHRFWREFCRLNNIDHRRAEYAS